MSRILFYLTVLHLFSLCSTAIQRIQPGTRDQTAVPTTTKDGQCPTVTVSRTCRTPIHLCRGDGDCTGNQKCCPDCGNKCVAPTDRSAGVCHKVLQKLASKSANNDTFVPTCDNYDDKFNRKQCNSRQCFCVNRDSGARKMGSSVNKISPLNCTTKDTCPNVRCLLYCAGGYSHDQNNCGLCSCQRCNRPACSPSCYEKRNANPCFSCKAGCSRSDACDAGRPCGRNDTCVAIKAAKQCKPKKDNTGVCTVSDIASGMSAVFSRGSQSRQLASSTFRSASCRGDYYCHRRANSTTGMCRKVPKNSSDDDDVPACLREKINAARSSNGTRPADSPRHVPNCRDDGRYEPAQCWGPACYCVRPDTGEKLNNTRFSDTQYSDRSKMCSREVVERKCDVSQGGQKRNISSGHQRVDKSQRRLCKCDDGMLTCRSLGNRLSKICTLEGGRTLRHGDRVTRDCNLCLCANSKIVCTRRKCNGTRDRCDVCDDYLNETSPVCHQRTGRSFRSSCHATECDDIPLDALVDGVCERLDPCDGVRCRSGQECKPVRKSCLFTDRDCPQYKCVDIELECKIERTNDTMVCGSDGRTYDNFCQLLSSGSKEEYRGQCSSDCSGSTGEDLQVCGEDGFTQQSRCHASSRRKRVQYDGACKSSCSQVRCAADRTCTRRVKVDGQCCPVCGSSALFSVDKTLLGDVADASDDGEAVNDVDRLKDSLRDRLPDDARSKCEASGYVTDKGDVSFSLAAKRGEDAEDCNGHLSDLVEKVNMGDESLADDPLVAALATAVVLEAETAPLVQPTNAQPTNAQPAGDVTTTASIGLLVLTVAVIALHVV